jgi:ABC-type phosphate transport system substrate-binding protein
MDTYMRQFARVIVILGAVLFLPAVSPLRNGGAAGFRLEETYNPQQTLAIIVNKSNPVDNLPFDELRKIFLGQRSRWANGHRIAVVMLERGQPERQTILREVYRMSENDYNRHLLKGLFTGDVFVAPKTLSSPLVLRKFVFNAPGAIGYLRAADVDSSVKVVRVDGLLPADSEYRLQIDARAVN